jgi:hypothetical protein
MVVGAGDGVDGVVSRIDSAAVEGAGLGARAAAASWPQEAAGASRMRYVSSPVLASFR